MLPQSPDAFRLTFCQRIAVARFLREAVGIQRAHLSFEEIVSKLARRQMKLVSHSFAARRAFQYADVP